MKIGIVCRIYTDKKGGKERYSMMLCRHLIQKGHTVHLFAHRADPEPGALFHRVPMFPLSSPAKHLSFAYFASRMAQKAGIEILHSMDRIMEQDIFRASDGLNPVQLQQCYPSPFVRWLKSIGPRRQVLGYLEKRIFTKGKARSIIANSRLVRDQILAHYPAAADLIRVIYNGVDTRRFHPGLKKIYRDQIRREYQIGPEKLLLIFVANDFKLKGLKTLMAAMKRLDDSDIEALIIGGGHPAPYRREAEKLGIAGQIHFTGTEPEVEKFLAAGDLFVLTTWYDPFANVCLEAMACGLPVITTTANGAAERIEADVNGYIIAPGAAENLARSIFRLRDQNRRDAMAKAAAETARACTWDAHFERIESLYEELS